MAAAVILFNVFIQAEEETEIVIQKWHTVDIKSMTISRDSKYIASGSWDHLVRLWDGNTGKEIRTFVGHARIVWSVDIYTNSTYIVSGSRDGEIKTWDSQTGYLLASMVSFMDNEWVAYTPDNYYICSPNGEKYVTFRKGNTIYDAETYSQTFKNAKDNHYRQRHHLHGKNHLRQNQ
jgi:WD40 repeat protein